MSEEVKNAVYVADDWCFCGHLQESYNGCCIDHRASNNWKMASWPEKSGWPKSEIDCLLDDEFEIMRKPALQVSHIASDASTPNSDKVICNAHSRQDCSACFDFGDFLLQDAKLWGKHSMCVVFQWDKQKLASRAFSYLKKAGLPVPAPPTPPPGIFERRYPRLRGFPDINAVSLPAEHTLAFKYPAFSLLNQLPAFTGHYPLGWVIFVVVVARRGPGVTYIIKDAAGMSMSLRFVKSWTLIDRGGDPTGEDAEPYKNLKPGTVLSLNCVTMSMTAHNEPQVAVEQINLSGVKILKSSIMDVRTINDNLRKAAPGCCSHCANVGAPSMCVRCKSPCCTKECQAKGLSSSQFLLRDELWYCLV
ncbi:hypothetical protein B0H16DRAFT_1881021 [Mycena metata]|uniref:MYND-type domain-containing protein n=1 Tax=Mycena metata TaxID=1033252 RepID=A0AAD7NRQ7_9AGAR|nr:hypothetical protein B0H16DRAFT_1881021 [Mycena metata]